jgi:hypothetical protein
VLICDLTVPHIRVDLLEGPAAPSKLLTHTLPLPLLLLLLLLLLQRPVSWQC